MNGANTIATVTTTPAVLRPGPGPEAMSARAASREEHRVVRIKELDALRGIAALLVVLFHFTMFRPQAQYGFRFGVTGVDLFFIISGYVIFLTINRVRTWRDFVVSRVARLYPAYWTAVLLTAFLFFLFDRSHFYPGAITANLTMLQNFMGITDLDGAYWTLAVELLFYGLMLLLYVSGQLKSAESWGLLFMGVTLLFHTSVPLFSRYLYENIKTYFPIINHAPLFFIGLLFYNIHQYGHTVRRHAAIAGSLLLACYLHDKGGTAVGAVAAGEHYVILSVYVLLFYLFIGKKLTFLINRYTIFLGTISYSLYLIHYTLCVKVIIPYLEGQGYSLFFSASIALMIALLVASSITFLVEQPANSVIKAYYKKTNKSKGLIG